MFTLPEWAPNVHPLIIHFPIALLISAVFVDLVSLFTRRWEGVQFAAIVLYAVGAVAAGAAFLTGRQAADSVDLPTAAISTLDQHADLAEATLWFYGIYAVIRLSTLWKHSLRARILIHLPLFLIGLGGLYLLYETADRGGRLVYAHGVGVQRPDPPVAPADAADDGEAAAEQFHLSEDGSWHWSPAQGASQILQQQFRFLEGGAQDLEARLVLRAEGDSILALQIAEGPVTIVAGGPVRGIDASIEIDVRGFDGTVMLVHHARDVENMDFLALSEGRMQLGRVREGRTQMFDDQAFASGGMLSLRAVAYGTHFRGYSAGRMVTHGHGAAPAAGAVGMRFDGTGTVLLGGIHVQVVAE
jgi:uncharacterized membrane protein